MKDKVNVIDIVDISNLNIHSIAEMHRAMSTMEFESLKDSIQSNGQLVPVITYKGKIVDGRHRYRALEFLGEETIKTTKLPGNMSLAEVKKRIQGTEMRRSDNSMQKAIRGYKDMLDGNNLTQEETGIKFGIGRDKISQAKKVCELRGIDFLNELYENGKVILCGKTLTQLRQIIKFYENIKVEKDTTYEAPSEILAEHYKTIKDLSTEELMLLAIRCKKLVEKREGE